MRQKGKRVLLIDLDPQGDATLWTGGVKDRRFSDWICDGGRTDLRERISGDLLPSSAAMAEVPERIGSRKDRVSILSRGMRQVSAGYDFIIIDCPPGDSLILANALFAADAYLVPVTPRHYSGLVALRNLAEDWAEAVPRPVASFAGAILCMAKEKTKATAETLERLRRQLGRKFVEPPVPFAVGVQDAWGERMVPGKKHGEKAAEAYQRIAEKIIRRGREWVS
jgi:chromosome partitioning protein